MAKEIRRIEIEPAENGGHTVVHHFKETMREGKHGQMPQYHEPERHVFGEDEGHEMLAHVANHLEIGEHEGHGMTEAEKKAVPKSGAHSAFTDRIRAKAKRISAEGAAKILRGGK